MVMADPSDLGHGKKTLYEALEEYQTAEMYEQECPMPHCKSKKAETTKKILKYPSSLNVVLKRFSFSKRKKHSCQNS